MNPTLTASSETIPVAGGDIHLLRGGAGPPLVFLHAAGGAGAWLPFHERLAAGFEVWAPDHPGFGRSDDIEDVETMEDLVYHYLDLLDRFELDRPVLVGASLGGWLAAELAVHASHRLGGLVLIGAIGLRVPGHPIADLFTMGPEETARTLFADPSVAAGLFPAEPDIEFLVQMLKDQTAFARLAWSPFCANPKLARRLHRVRTPTLVLWGEQDRLVDLEHGRRYAELIPDAELRVLGNCGHAAHMERPDETADAIAAFAQR